MGNARVFYTTVFTCLFCISCTNTPPSESIMTEISTFTHEKPASSITPSLTNPPTSTKLLPVCDPHISDFCIVDGSFYFVNPIPDSGTRLVDRSYAYASTSAGSRNPHLGVEFYNPSGTPILAVGDGSVIFVGNDLLTPFFTETNFYGNLIIIKHSLEHQDLYSFYAHLSKFDVTIGQSVSQGEKIGEVGSTGAAIGSHLHFEFRLDYTDYTTTLNPELWLVPLPSTGVLAIRFQDENGDFIGMMTNIQYFPGSSDGFTYAWQPEPYSNVFVHADSWENITLGNLESGRYRVSYIWDGILFERWVEIEVGKLTIASFIIH